LEYLSVGPQQPNTKLKKLLLPSKLRICLLSVSEYIQQRTTEMGVSVYSMAKMLTNTMTVMLVLSSVLAAAGGQVVDTDDLKCKGAVVFYGENYSKLNEIQESPKRTSISLLEVEKIKAENCCFFIYSGRNHKGTKKFFFAEEVKEANQIGFKKVKSIKKVSCQQQQDTQQASPYALVIGCVVGAVIVVAAVLVIATKIYRRKQFESVSTSGDA